INPPLRSLRWQIECFVHRRIGWKRRKPVAWRAGCAPAHAAFSKRRPEMGLVRATGIDSIREQNGITRLKKVRVGRAQLHSIGDQAESKIIAVVETEFDDQFCARLPQ